MPEESMIWDKSGALSRLAGNEELLKKVMVLFLQQIPEDIAKLQQAIENEQYDQVASTAHSIKGVAGNLGANALLNNAAQMQQLAQQHKLQELSDLLAQIRVDEVHIRERFTAYLNA
ncbi:Hpt domain-containing protein [Alteromonadaceae bacterium BrNp21-10]|nr:Hpt domain-containing protein [Alteromonadaceae bacterium BrNp21-10]